MIPLLKKKELLLVYIKNLKITKVIRFIYFKIFDFFLCFKYKKWYNILKIKGLKILND